MLPVQAKKKGRHQMLPALSCFDYGLLSPSATKGDSQTNCDDSNTRRFWNNAYSGEGNIVAITKRVVDETAATICHQCTLRQTSELANEIPADIDQQEVTARIAAAEVNGQISDSIGTSQGIIERHVAQYVEHANAARVRDKVEGTRTIHAEAAVVAGER